MKKSPYKEREVELFPHRNIIIGDGQAALTDVFSRTAGVSRALIDLIFNEEFAHAASHINISPDENNENVQHYRTTFVRINNRPLFVGEWEWREPKDISLRVKTWRSVSRATQVHFAKYGGTIIEISGTTQLIPVVETGDTLIAGEARNG